MLLFNEDDYIYIYISHATNTTNTQQIVICGA